MFTCLAPFLIDALVKRQEKCMDKFIDFLKGCVGLLFICLIVWIIWTIHNGPSTPAQKAKAAAEARNAEILPRDQNELCSTVASFCERYKKASNEFQKTAIRRERRAAISNILPDRSAIDWIGAVTRMITDSNGDGTLQVKLPGSSNIKMFTWSNALIPYGSSLYNQVANLAEGDKVVFSGRFIPGDRDYIMEASLFEEGAMTEPEFIFTFTSVRKITDRADDGHKQEQAEEATKDVDAQSH